MQDYKEKLIRDIVDVLNNCSIKLLEYILNFTKSAHNAWDK